MIWWHGGGGVAEIWHDDKGEGGVWLPPENDDVIYEQPLIRSKGSKEFWTKPNAEP